MASSATLEIGGLRFCAWSNEPGLSLYVDGPAARFQCAAPEADVRLRVQRAEPPPIAGPRLFAAEELWQMFRTPTGYDMRFATTAGEGATYKTARFNADFTEGEVFLHPEFFPTGKPVSPLDFPLDELLMVQLLAAGRGIEMHACGVVDAEGRGLLFTGQSGHGKSTTARLWLQEPGVRVLSDDRIILREEDGRLWMYGTPWHGDAGLAEPGRAPLCGIYILRHGPENRFHTPPPAALVAELLARSFLPFHEEAGLAFSLEFLERVTQRVACQELWFVPDSTAVRCVQEHAARLGEE